jgi:hypothetical protein
MNDDVAERIIQKTAALIEQNVEMNAKILGFMVVNETISAINGRIDAIAGGIKALEKGVQLDENKLQQLEWQSKEIKEGLQAFKKTAEGLSTAVQRLEGKVGRLEDLTKSAGMYIDRLKWRVSLMWFIHLLTVAFLVAIFILLKIH